MWARSVERLTVAVTPSTLFSLAWTRAAQAAQVIPPMASSTSVTSGAAMADMLVKVLLQHRGGRADRAMIAVVETRSIVVVG
jgi:hypothetical protein